MLFGCTMSHMATGKKQPTVESKALSIAIRRAMATREMKTPGLAEASAIPYGTMRKILELNTVADYEQLRRIAMALNIPLSEIVADAERLSKDPGVREDYEASEQPLKEMDDTSVSGEHPADDLDVLADDIAAHPERYDLAANRDPNKENEMTTPRE